MSAFRWDLEWRTTALTALLLPALVALGFWQLQRADEKADLAQVHAQRWAAPPSALGELARLGPEDLAFRRAAVKGVFDPDVVILLDNQIRDGRYGVDVLGLLHDSDSGFGVLVNRGWIAADPARRSLPEVVMPEGEQRFTASVYVPPGQPYLLAEEAFSELRWPLLVQQANSHALRTALEAQQRVALFPRELRMDPAAPDGFRRDWPVINVAPEKHQGYAVQWFTMAAALLLFFIFRSSNLLPLIRGRAADSSKEP